MLTTVDNPFDPFTQFDEWDAWDRTAGYYTNGLLARVARVSQDMSDADVEEALHQGMLEVVEENISGVHRMVTKEGLSVS